MPNATPPAALHERPLAEKPRQPLWSENYCFQAYDPSIDVGFWTHVGLPAFDFRLWHDITVIYLPGGEELLLAKGYGVRSGLADVAGSMVHADYDAATGDWLVRFHGAGHRASRRKLMSSPAIDASAEPFACELRYHGMSRVWDLKQHVSGQSWSDAHWEQPCTVTGWVELGGKQLPFAGAGVRDHSRGARDFAHMGPYYWLHGEFPSGRAFGLLHVESSPGQPPSLSQAYLVERGELRDATVVSLPDDRAFVDPFSIVLSAPTGDETIIGTLRHEMTFTLTYPNDVLFGFRRGDPQHLVREGQIAWSWNGETGFGVGERGVTLPANGSPKDR
jgi:hypothetical protein